MKRTLRKLIRELIRELRKLIRELRKLIRELRMRKGAFWRLKLIILVLKRKTRNINYNAVISINIVSSVNTKGKNLKKLGR